MEIDTNRKLTRNKLYHNSSVSHLTEGFAPKPSPELQASSKVGAHCRDRWTLEYGFQYDPKERGTAKSRENRAVNTILL